MGKMLDVLLAGTALVAVAAVPIATAAEKTVPYPHYWMSVSTTNQTMPGMSEEMAGMAAMFGGRGAAFGPKRELLLQVEGPRVVPQPEAVHAPPLGQNMGDRLPLVTPRQEKAESRPERHEQHHEKPEKPKARMLIYWGCGETVPKGQPRVIDTEKMSPADFGRALSGRSATQQTPPMPRTGWTYGDWPNAEDRKEVPKDASLVGGHVVKGNYLPDISFTLDQKRDFMAPVEFAELKRTTAGAWQFQWKPIPTASGYFATAMGHNQKTGETIFWSASEVPETGFGLMSYLTNGDVARFLKEKVIMPPSRTSCSVPAGVFNEAEGAMLQFIAYGEELNIVHPPRPKNPKQPWNPQWSLKVRLKSSGSTPLMVAEQEGEKRGTSSRRPAAQESDGQEPQEPRPEKRGGGMFDGLKGMLGF